MNANVQVIYESTKNMGEEWILCFQRCVWKYSDNSTEEGYRFIWKRPDGSLQPARGQARIPEIYNMIELLADFSSIYNNVNNKSVILENNDIALLSEQKKLIQYYQKDTMTFTNFLQNYSVNNYINIVAKLWVNDAHFPIVTASMEELGYELAEKYLIDIDRREDINILKDAWDKYIRLVNNIINEEEESKE